MKPGSREINTKDPAKNAVLDYFPLMIVSVILSASGKKWAASVTSSGIHTLLPMFSSSSFSGEIKHVYFFFQKSNAQAL